MILSVTDLLALVIVGLAAWKVMRVARARLRPPGVSGSNPGSKSDADAGKDGSDDGCSDCRQCAGRASRR
ncbi:hypothetical protein [Methyloversatilis sp.]|uniref:hypothetical protein n=1 Tax=Methyloversatilis sp. TaxID=2569862 RepID=UPI002736B182|nr:hypothetical protein [Methyloversatilis sp.]MDP2869236.1 hypothetical protein [Methyloversatilis sp.]MDP3289143.1 hypothetical protein [Methyloversatilis sp.]MDP3454980.1 hypothetical protein [Methyloversatilis sp.]MDP3576880.1 hypothetical protein [Methyloversatilis sp.]